MYIPLFSKSSFSFLEGASQPEELIEAAASLGLTGEETFDIDLPVSKEGLVEPRCEVKVTATKPDGKKTEFVTRCRIDTPVEAEYYRNGGVLQTVLRRLLNESRKPVTV